MKTSFEEYVEALKLHNSKVASGARTNRASLWQKHRKALAEFSSDRIVTQETIDAFRAKADKAAAE